MRECEVLNRRGMFESCRDRQLSFGPLCRKQILSKPGRGRAGLVDRLVVLGGVPVGGGCNERHRPQAFPKHIGHAHGVRQLVPKNGDKLLPDFDL